MENKVILIVLFLLSHTNGYCQEDTIERNLIITVNGELEEGVISNIRFSSKHEGQRKEIQVLYIPGSLRMKLNDYDKIFLDDGDSVVIAFDHSQYCDNKQLLSNYEIPFDKSWLKYSFLILRVYDLSRGRFKNVFQPLSANKNYTFELTYPSGNLMRPRLKKTKEKDKCH